MAPKAGLNEQKVVAAAVDLVDDAGLDALTVGALAERLGVKPPSLYKHIAGLDGLRRDMALYGLRELAGKMGQAAIGKSGADALMALALAYRAFAKERPALYSLTVRAPEPSDAAMVAAGEELLAVIQAVLSAYHLDATAMVHVIRGFRTIVHGFVSLEILGAFGMPIDIEDSFRHLVSAFIQGIPVRAEP